MKHEAHSAKACLLRILNLIVEQYKFLVDPTRLAAKEKKLKPF